MTVMISYKCKQLLNMKEKFAIYKDDSHRDCIDQKEKKRWQKAADWMIDEYGIKGRKHSQSAAPGAFDHIIIIKKGSILKLPSIVPQKQ